MSRTYKRFPRGVFRSPRGYRKAILNCLRAKSVPPSENEDISYDRHCWLPFRAALNMANEGFHPKEALERIRTKFHLNYEQAKYVVIWVYDYPKNERAL